MGTTAAGHPAYTTCAEDPESSSELEREKMRRIVGGVAALAMLLVAAPSVRAQSADTPAIVVDDGVTQPAFGYADAIRERVWVDADFDSDRDGVNDVIAVDVIRPAATEEGLDVPVIIDDSPYYTTLGRGNEAELKTDLDGDGLLDRWPLFYDNYFVPRGYAVALVDMTGTAGSSGCPTIQGANENASGPMVIDWLNGRRSAKDAVGNEVTVDWHNGKSALIGKSYDGSLAMALAVSGVDGLSTVVPISGPYNYYDYTRSNGIVMRGNNYLVSLARAVTKGILDGQNRNSIAVAESMVPGEMYNITFPLLPNDHVFAAGNRIGVVVVGSYRSYSASRISRGRRSQSMRRSAESPCRS
jgi:X-Pro dipeptidyl-peptidase